MMLLHSQREEPEDFHFGESKKAP